MLQMGPEAKYCMANLCHARMYVHLLPSLLSVLGGRSDDQIRWEVCMLCLRERSEIVSYCSSAWDKEVTESIPKERTSPFTIILSPRNSLQRVANDIPLFDEATLTNYSWNATVIGTVLQNFIAHGDNAFKWGRCDNILSVGWKWVSFHL